MGTKFPSMKTIDILRQNAAGLASLIEGTRESELRVVAVAVARAVVGRTGLSDPVVERALERLERAPGPDADLRASVQGAAAQLDEEYFLLKEPLEEREDAGKTDPQVSVAFSKARAASAVAAAFGEDDREAAASAAYEAACATAESDYLIDAVKRALAK